MIRKYEHTDLDQVMKIWLDTNIRSHAHIPKGYWLDAYDMVREMLPQAELYVYEDGDTKQIEGFIGLTEDYIEGLFVREAAQSNGIGKQLLDHVKNSRPSLHLRVYQKNERAIRFYQREDFLIHSEDIDADTNEKEYRMIWIQ